MPYIKPERRPIYRYTLDKLINILLNTKKTNELELAGDLTYCLYRIVKKLGTSDNTRYRHHSWIKNSLLDAHHEYQLKVSDPYERKKEIENGDIT